MLVQRLRSSLPMSYRYSCYFHHARIYLQNIQDSDMILALINVMFT